MLNFNQQVFLNLSETHEERDLAPGLVVNIDGPNFTAQFDTDIPALEHGQTARIYFHRQRTFMQQLIRVEKFDDPMIDADDADEDAKPTLVFTLLGEAISAEGRQVYRVFAGLTGLSVTFAGNPNCPLQDTSSTGLALIAPTQHALGDTVDVALHHDGKHYTGKVRVQSVKELDDQMYRYGAHCLDSRQGGGNLLHGIRQLSTAVERQQLRRLSGAA